MNQFSRAVLSALLPAMALASIAATAPAWAQTAPAQNAPARVAPAKATFTSKDYGFALYLPATPQTQKKALPAQLGSGTTNVYFTPPNPVSYSIVPIVLPAAAAGIPQKLYFDSVQQGILTSSKGKIVGARDVQVNGQTARDFQWVFSTPTPASEAPVKFNGRTRIYKIGPRTLQFTAVVASADFAKSQAQIVKVMDSIVISK